MTEIELAAVPKPFSIVAYGRYVEERGNITEYIDGEIIDPNQPLYVKIASPTGTVYPWERIIRSDEIAQMCGARIDVA